MRVDIYLFCFRCFFFAFTFPARLPARRAIVLLALVNPTPGDLVPAVSLVVVWKRLGCRVNIGVDHLHGDKRFYGFVY